MQVIRTAALPRTPRPARSGYMQYSFWYLVLVATIIGSFLLIPAQIKFTADDDITIASFAAIGIYALAALYLTSYQRPFTMNCSHWIFMLFFFSYAPLIQFLTQNFPGQADIGVFEPYHLEVNALLLLWCVCYSVTYKYVHALKPKQQGPIPAASDVQKPNYPWLALYCLACTAFAVVMVGWGSLMSRAATSDGVGASSSPVYLITSTVGRVSPLVVLALLLITGRRRQIWYYAALAVAVGCALITNFPPAMARFAAGGTAIALICLWLRNRRASSLWLLLVFWLGFVVAMPFLNLFRYNSFQTSDVSTYHQQDIASTVTGGDFDAYMMMIATVSYGQRPGNITMGRQLAGGLLFFVPRAMWPDKPEASGGLVVQNTILSFYNLSEPLPAEGYVNFGVPGVILFAVAFAWILALLDKSYWFVRDRSPRARPTILTVMYPFLIGAVIILMRGSFLTSFAYTVGPIAAYWLTLKVAYVGSIPRFGAKSKKRLGPAAPPAERVVLPSGR